MAHLRTKSLFGRISDTATAIAVVVLGLGMVWDCSYLFWEELHSPDGVPTEISIIIVAILAAVAVICSYAAYRFARNALRPADSCASDPL
jgi:hypothetical protein